MHLSTLTEKGNFDSARASIVLNNQMIQDKLIDEIIENMNDKGYYGLTLTLNLLTSRMQRNMLRLFPICAPLKTLWGMK